MSDEEIKEFSFPMKEGYEMEAEESVEGEEVTTEEVVAEEKTETEEVKTEEVTTEEVIAEETSTEEVVDNENKEQEVEPEETNNSSLIRDEILKSTGDKFESVDALNNAYNDLRETVSGRSYVESLNAAVEEQYGEGVTFADVMNYQAINFDEMDDLSVVREQLEKQYDNITPEQLNAHMRPYSLLEKSDAEIAELVEDGDVQQYVVDDLRANLMRKAMDARTELKEFQSSINIEELQISSPRIAEEAAPIESEADRTDRLERYNSIINSMPDNTFDVGDKNNPVSFTLQKTEEDRNGVSEFLKGDTLDGVERSFIDKHWAKEGGGVDVEKLSRDMYKVVNYERDVKLGYAQGKSATSKEVKDIDNINFNKSETAGTQMTSDEEQRALISSSINS